MEPETLSLRGQLTRREVLHEGAAEAGVGGLVLEGLQEGFELVGGVEAGHLASRQHAIDELEGLGQRRRLVVLQQQRHLVAVHPRLLHHLGAGGGGETE